MQCVKCKNIIVIHSDQFFNKCFCKCKNSYIIHDDKTYIYYYNFKINTTNYLFAININKKSKHYLRSCVIHNGKILKLYNCDININHDEIVNKTQVALKLKNLE